ncbi:YebG family protein [Salmonella enterica]
MLVNSRKGEEKIVTLPSKKEADAWDKMLDIYCKNGRLKLNDC